MTIYPITLPVDDGIASMSLSMLDVSQRSESPFTLQRGQIIDYAASQWGLTITIPPVGRDVAQKWLSFLAKLRGTIGTFQCPVPGHIDPLGAAREVPGIPRVNGAGQTGFDILIDGVPSSTYEYLAEGDFIQIGTRQHMVTERANTNSAGAVRLYDWQEIQGEHHDNTHVLVQNGMGVFQLREPLREINLSSFDTYGLTINAREVY